IQTDCQIGDALVAVGSDNGKKPIAKTVVLTAINKYEGPETLECTGLPEYWSSGGGLFQKGVSVRVSVAANPASSGCLYLGIGPIVTAIGQAKIETPIAAPI
ncbi:MAG TPA: hypothetical protein VFG20_03090, partial [Planctomycetaceae bacterium]|nr:hypothetical protein [Planctomycetaceae bacterium]